MPITTLHLRSFYLSLRPFWRALTSFGELWRALTRRIRFPNHEQWNIRMLELILSFIQFPVGWLLLSNSHYISLTDGFGEQWLWKLVSPPAFDIDKTSRTGDEGSWQIARYPTQLPPTIPPSYQSSPDERETHNISRNLLSPATLFQNIREEFKYHRFKDFSHFYLLSFGSLSNSWIETTVRLFPCRVSINRRDYQIFHFQMRISIWMDEFILPLTFIIYGAQASFIS